MKDYIAIFDIGSNAVRLVIYDGLSRAPVRIHNERNLCTLGAGLAATGYLDPQGIEKALSSLGRFSGLVTALKIKNVRAVATAAVREAKNGSLFIERIKKEFGLTVEIIDGEEEARLSALGVLANGLGRNGLIGDYGGGSLELISITEGKIKNKISLPIGSHRLHILPSRARKIKEIDAQLDTVDFLQAGAGRDFCALGGAWRSMAKVHMHFVKHPLQLLDHYTIKGSQAESFAGLLSQQSPSSLEKTVGLSRQRVRDISVSALVMERLLARMKPENIVFSAAGLREGLIFDQLPPTTKRQDGLIASCHTFALRVSRYDDIKTFQILSRWMESLFEGATPHFQRLLEASCILSDTCGFEHEDYQAEHAFRQIFVLPLFAIDHSGRAFLALSQYVRYKGYLRRGSRGGETHELTRPAQTLLDAGMINLAVRAGLAQRLAYLLTGGALELLKLTSLEVGPKNLTLQLGPKATTLNADTLQHALHSLAVEMGKESLIKI
jgi:exopolyphosphatase/guanosine-5'-triphosphate,3'-diphosphate pyrophosphatase